MSCAGKETVWLRDLSGIIIAVAAGFPPAIGGGILPPELAAGSRVTGSQDGCLHVP